MDILENLRQWLLSYPGWGGCSVEIGCAPVQPGCAGLSLIGMEERDRQTDLQGNALVQNRLLLQLQCNLPVTGQDGQWLLDFVTWLRCQSITVGLPQLGCHKNRQQLVVKQGKPILCGQTVVYRLELQLDYWEYWEVENDD